MLAEAQRQGAELRELGRRVGSGACGTLGEVQALVREADERLDALSDERAVLREVGGWPDARWVCARLRRVGTWPDAGGGATRPGARWARV